MDRKCPREDGCHRIGGHSVFNRVEYKWGKLGVDFLRPGHQNELMSTAALAHSLFDLPVSERILLADQLYASVPDHWQRSADEAWLAEAERRSADMDADPSLEITHEAFLACITSAGRRS